MGQVGQESNLQPAVLETAADCSDGSRQVPIAGIFGRAASRSVCSVPFKSTALLPKLLPRWLRVRIYWSHWSNDWRVGDEERRIPCRPPTYRRHEPPRPRTHESDAAVVARRSAAAPASRMRCAGQHTSGGRSSYSRWLLHPTQPSPAQASPKEQHMLDTLPSPDLCSSA